jgi:hypothetical protein
MYRRPEFGRECALYGKPRETDPANPLNRLGAAKEVFPIRSSQPRRCERQPELHSHVESFDGVDVVSDEMREIVAKNFPDLLASCPAEVTGAVIAEATVGCQ